MKYALVNPQDEVVMVVKGTDRFAVAPPLKWVACPNEAAPDKWVRNGNDIVPAVPDLAFLRKMQLARLTLAMQDALDEPVTVAGNIFKAKPVHRARVERLLDRSARGKNLPAKIKTAGGNKVTLTQPLLENIRDAIQDQIDAAHAKYIDLEDLVEAATTDAEIEAVVW